MPHSRKTPRDASTHGMMRGAVEVLARGFICVAGKSLSIQWSITRIPYAGASIGCALAAHRFCETLLPLVPLESEPFCSPETDALRCLWSGRKPAPPKERHL